MGFAQRLHCFDFKDEASLDEDVDPQRRFEEVIVDRGTETRRATFNPLASNRPASTVS